MTVNFLTSSLNFLNRLTVFEFSYFSGSGTGSRGEASVLLTEAKGGISLWLLGNCEK